MTDSYAAVLDALRPGITCYVPGATGEPLGLSAALAREPDRAAGIDFVGCFLPGINNFDYAALHTDARLTTFLLPDSHRATFDDGRTRALPLGYTQIARYFSENRVDVAIAHVASPDEFGRCSFGIAADFTPLVWPRARQRIAVVNRSMPSIHRAPSVALADADIVIEVEEPLVEGMSDIGGDDPIARSIVELVPDGSTVQLGIGRIPSAVWGCLGDHRNLTFHSGLIAPQFEALAAAGALRPGGGHRTGFAIGARSFYDFLAKNEIVDFRPVPETHGMRSLAAIDRFTSINAILEIDLFGQVNVEWRGNVYSAGVGGAAEFARAAAASPGGKSIMALPSTGKGGAVSRIVPRLTVPSISLARTDVDWVVTENGRTHLPVGGPDQRAEALIGLAAPQHREELGRSWRALRAH